ncbi:MAG: hypothetical protein HOW97_17055 [Catenulispora sp.]|nr:hypothetical protein [Catenulispora sp.]
MAEHESAADTPAARITRFEQRTMDLLDENQQLRAELAAANERAEKAEADRDEACFRRDKADLRAAKLRLVAASMLRTFAMGQNVHPDYAAKVSHPVPVADVERWQTVVRETSLAADAAQDGRSATETDNGGSPVSVDAANSSAKAAGLSEAEAPQRHESAKTTCGYPACGYPEHQRNNDETGDDRD